MLELWRLAINAFAIFITSTQKHRILIPGICLECGDLFRRHEPALETETEQGGRAETLQVSRFDCAQIALGFDMQADRPTDRYREVFPQKFLSDHLMAHIHALLSYELVAIMQKVPDIVQQRGDDQRLSRTMLSRSLCALQGMGAFCDGFAIHPVTALIEDCLYAGDAIIGQGIIFLLQTGCFEIRGVQDGSRLT